MIKDSAKQHHRTLNEILTHYEDAKAWLESLGINVNPTRFRNYKRIIEQSGKEYSENYDYKQDWNMLWALSELDDLLSIHRDLKAQQDMRMVDSLRKITTGPILLDDEKNDGGSIQGRNFTFELYAAARIARAGFSVNFNTIADANFLVGERQIHMECKRVVSEDNMEGLVISACKQIAKRCNDSPSDRGIAAISISKLVWKAFEGAAKGVHADVDTIRLAMIANLDKWGPEITKRFERFNKHTSGILLHYKMPFRRNTDGAATVLNRFALYPICDASAPEMASMKNLSEQLLKSAGNEG
ncbi:hypothetical protein JAB1_24640 [Janthinobacterium sp. MP5059B]|uniref:hypothetical protein n=1 Tax=Janthinobacterium sp. MP5059B TaxID=1766683 RepID=UPI0008940924|nr:hypothetical protein [Janthinobacterium sp. MP5059B]OEZ49274.1 hypothetical protein JAB1_24640 [Janthinobacterium sp. MP5059B]